MRAWGCGWRWRDGKANWGPCDGAGRGKRRRFLVGTGGREGGGSNGGRKGFDPGNLGDGGGFRSAGESGIEEGWVPTWGEAGTGLKVSAVGLMETGAARSDGAKAEVRIHEGSTDQVRA